METLYSKVRKTAIDNAQKNCIVFYGKRLTYQKFLKYVDTFAGNLVNQGFKAGDVVTVCLPNSPSAAIAFYAINKLGAICNLVHPFTPAEQLKSILLQTKSKLLITYDIYTIKHGIVDFGIPTYLSRSSFFMNNFIRFFFNLQKRVAKNNYKKLEKMFVNGEALDGFYEFTDKQPAVFLPSGGTTGEPKTIMHNCSAFNFICQNIEFFLNDPISTYKSIYSVLPIFHGFGLCMSLHLSLLNGITNIMSMKFEVNQAIKLIKREKVGFMMGVPTMFKRLLESKKFCNSKTPSLLECFVGGDYVPDQLIEQFNQVLQKKGSKGRLLVGYGLAETVAACVVNTIKQNKTGALGKPIPQTEYLIQKEGKIVDDGSVGEILISCPMLMLGYFESSQNPIVEIKGKKWLQTGDYGFIDSDGFLHYKQRVKNIIKINGVPVFPSEIEQIVSTVEGVSNCCAVGVPDSVKGETVRLFVETSKDCNKQEIENQIRSLLKRKVIRYALPEEIVFLEQLPTNNIGKVDRKQLSSMDNVTKA